MNKKIGVCIIVCSFVLQPFGRAEGSFFRFDSQPELISWETHKGNGKDFSGITHIEDNNYLLINDDDCSMSRFQFDGTHAEVSNRIKVSGLQDCEAIVHLRDLGSGRHQFATVEERKGNVVTFVLDANTERLNCSEGDCEIQFFEKVSSWFNRNSGLEAMTYISETQTLILGKEKNPRKIYLAKQEGLKFSKFDSFKANLFLPKGGDIAGMAYFDGHLFILDQQKDAVYQVNIETRKVLSEFNLPPSAFRKYEGIALTRKSSGFVEMVIVAEKNEILVYRF